MLNFLLCDDEKVITSQLSQYIDAYYKMKNKEYTITTCANGLELYHMLENRRDFDIIFLDIDLKDSNGINIARKIRTLNKKVKIIFISNHKNYKSAAFTVRAFGYIEKPADKQQIFQQLDDIENYISAEKSDIILKFETKEGYTNICVKDILYFESSNRKIIIHTFHSSYEMKQQISKLYTTMSQYHFGCPHSSFLVNLDYIIGIKNYTVYLVNNIEIPLSQRKANEFNHMVNQFLAQTISICKGEKPNV